MQVTAGIDYTDRTKTTLAMMAALAPPAWMAKPAKPGLIA